jgi:hypothetical protein
MTSKQRPMQRALPLLATSLLLSACQLPDVVERPAAEASASEATVCRELGRDFPSWAYDGEPETVANRVDTEVSVEMGLTYTNVFKAVCPGVLE